MIGFSMHEIMEGTHQFETDFSNLADDRYMNFSIKWSAKSLLSFLNPFSKSFLVSDVDGTITIDGLCIAAPCKGTMALKYFTNSSIEYKFDFNVDGKDYKYDGKKINIKPWNLPKTHTTCYGTVKESVTGALVSTSITFFRLWRIPSFLGSFRLTKGNKYV